jgi:hypothetical protein
MYPFDHCYPYDRLLYYFAPDFLKRVHDFGMVWPFKIAAGRYHQQHAIVWRDLVFVGHSAGRIFVSGSGQPFGVYWQRRAIFAHAVKNFAGGNHACCVCDLFNPDF